MNIGWLVALGVVVFLVWNQFHWQPLRWPQKALKVPRFQAHRGYHQLAEENTLAAFRAAKKAGATMFELDVRLSRDHVPVVFHDVDLMRLAGRPEKVFDLTLAELKAIAPIPTLQEVLTDPESQLLVNIELKSSGLVWSHFEKAVAQVVQSCQAEHRVLFSSFNPLSLRRLARYLPEVPRALLASQEPDDGNKIYLRKLWFAPYIKIHLLHLDHRYVGKAEMLKYKKRQIPVALWTVNEATQARDLLDLGALSIISDEFMREADLTSRPSGSLDRGHEYL